MNLLNLAERELNAEALRILPKVYDENELLFFNSEKLYKNIKNIYLKYNVCIELRVAKYCNFVKYGGNQLTENCNLRLSISHNKKYINHKKSQNQDLNKYTKTFIERIKENSGATSLLYLIPKIFKEVIKFHYDSVDYLAMIYLIQEELDGNYVVVSDRPLRIKITK